MINNDALDNASLRYLAGLKQIISECSMSPVSLPTASPHTPANISITAGSGDELSQMLKNIMSIAGVHKVEPQHMPVISTEPTMAKVNTHPSMKELVGKMDAIDHLEDSMNSGERPWDTSPHEEILDTKFPQDGDQNNNAVAAKDERVSRQHATSLPEATLENLFSAYKNFVAEESKPKCCCKAKGKSACPDHGKKKVKESTLVFGNEDPEARKIAKTEIAAVASRERNCKAAIAMVPITKAISIAYLLTLGRNALCALFNDKSNRCVVILSE